MQKNFNFTAQCNKDCYCGPVGLFPVCDRNGTVYFNPCEAGCTNLTIVNMETFDFQFKDCMCMNGTNWEENVVSRHFCKDDCLSMTYWYFGLMILSGVIAGTAVIPGILIVLRSVPEEHRSVALGFSGFIVALLSTFPSPIILGNIVDSACIRWAGTGCGSGGFCEIYDPHKLRIRIHAFTGALRTIALLFDIWVWYYAKNLVLMGDTNKSPAEEIAEGEEEDAKEVERKPIGV